MKCFPDWIRFDAENCVHLPASKSIGARYLVASYFAGSLPMCREFNDCDDLKVIQKALNLLSLNEDEDETEILRVDVNASGTAFRFMAAVIASTPGADYMLTGTPRLVSRPMGPLLDVLRAAGASVEGVGEEGKGPFHIKGAQLAGGEFEIRGDISSQFISALMLAAPTWSNGMSLRFTTSLVSRPYVEMTARIMEKFGVTVNLTEEGVTVPHAQYVAPADFEVEADWTAASYFYASCCANNNSICIAGLKPEGESLQGDSKLAEFFRRITIGSGFKDGGVVVAREDDANDYVEIDLTHNPDLMPALAIACLLQATRFKFTGVKNLRIKECDRLLAMKTEIEKFGFPIVVEEDSIEWRGGCWSMPDPITETYDDHRIAMAFAAWASGGWKVRIAHPEVVNKSFSTFWDQLDAIGLDCKMDGDVMCVSRKKYF